MAYKICKLQNTSGFSSEKPGIIIQEGDPGWEVAYKKWLKNENPTDSELWKHGAFAITQKFEYQCPCHYGGYDGAGVCKQPCDECDDPVLGCTTE